jgi:hypothetical protein
MTPENIAELATIDQRIADAFVACDASYIALKEAITLKTDFCSTIFVA